MPQIYCNNHAHAAHAICSSGAECHGHANAPSSTALWPCTEADVAAMSIGSDTVPQTSRNGDIKQSLRPAGLQADLACAAGPFGGELPTTIPDARLPIRSFFVNIILPIRLGRRRSKVRICSVASPMGRSYILFSDGRLQSRLTLRVAVCG